MSDPLTASQRNLALENVGLIGPAVGGRRRDHDDYQEAQGEAALALCSAARRFEDGRGAKFGTYAFVSIRHALRKLDRRRRRFSPARLSDLDAESLRSREPDPSRGLESEWAAISAALALDSCGSRAAELLRLVYLEGLTLTESGRLLGLTKQSAARLRDGALLRLRSWAEERS